MSRCHNAAHDTPFAAHVWSTHGIRTAHVCTGGHGRDWTYPFGTVVRVTYLRNRRSVTVVIVDRGPYGKNRQEGAIIDLSPVAAKKLGMLRVGQARVKLEVLAWGNGKYLN